MKKLFLCLFLINTLCFAKELAGTDLQAVNKALDSKLHANDYEELSGQLAYIQKIENQIATMTNLSDEAKLICKNILILEKETLKSADYSKKNKDKKAEKKDPALEALVQKCYNEYKAFDETHSNLSSHFYYHYLETEVTLLGFLPVAKQLSAGKEIIEKYKKLDELYPNYGENLFTYGMVLYMMPKIAGGDKEAGLAKIKKATYISSSDYEKASALILYSQILFEKKQKEESKTYLMKAQALAPNNTSFKEIQTMNDEGYSFFDAKDYMKKQ